MTNCVFCDKENPGIAYDMPCCFHCYLKHDQKEFQDASSRVQHDLLTPTSFVICDDCGSQIPLYKAKVVKGFWYCNSGCNYN